MYQIFITRKSKKVENNKIEITSHDKLKIFESTDYEKSHDEYNTHIKSELDFIAIIDFSTIHSIIELYHYDTDNHSHRLIKIITLQNF